MPEATFWALASIFFIALAAIILIKEIEVNPKYEILKRIAIGLVAIVGVSKILKLW